VPQINCSIVTPSKKYFEGDVYGVKAPGIVGEFETLPGHESFVSVLDVGIVEIELDENSEKIKFVIVGGYFEISDDRVFVIADEVYSKDDIDVDDVRKKLDKYNNELNGLSFDSAEYERINRIVKKYKAMLELAS